MTSTLALHDGRVGNARQATALARALDADAGECLLHPHAPWRWLAPRALPGADRGYGAEFGSLRHRPPQLAIGCGRQAALATRLLRTRGSRAVQILDPRIDTRHWDLVIAPRHDGLQGGNVLTMLGSLNPVDDDWLQLGRAAFPMLEDLPRQHTVMLVGGSTRHAALDDADFTALLRMLSARALSEGGSFSAIASRRTPSRWCEALGTVDATIPGLRWRDTGDGANPYAGLLAFADRIVCTPDSVNMLSEASATRAPVFVWQPEAASGRIGSFVRALCENGRVRPLDDAMAAYTAEPLRETARMAALVRERLTR